MSDVFTRELEHVLRYRRERTRIHRIALKARKFVKEIASIEVDGGLRQWASPEAEKLYDELEQLVLFLGET